ncbi:MAG: glycoside hydrolase family 97 protein [Candidatus Eiseniibacteriota bacterium]|nr:MAG: glycoside hydrolase family 97 protein [Candidatus Eisenbacteria bacterium]
MVSGTRHRVAAFTGLFTFSSLLLLSVLLAGQAVAAESEARLEIFSPDESIVVAFMLKQGAPFYEIKRSGVEIIRPSRMGFQFKNAAPLDGDFAVADSRASSFDETWVQPWGEVKEIRNRYNELRVELEETSAARRRMTVVFRVYDCGVGFRYELPRQENLKDVEIMDEKTEFALTGPHDAWWIPAYRDNRYEYLYTKSSLAEMDTVHTPLTMQTADGFFLSIHEAALTDYASMTVASKGDNVLKCDLVPWSDGVRVKASTPFVTPWRTLQIAENPGELITCYLILNLNEPCVLEDVSWLRPGKYAGIWWGMHIGKYTWGSGDRHGATTANVKKYIDFAAENGFLGVLVEGWNLGWDSEWWLGGSVFDFTTPYDDFGIEELSRYAAAKGVKIIGHHETSAAIENYESQVDAAFSFCRRYGIDVVKTGYVGTRVSETEWHHGQYMVRHCRKIVEKAAKNRIMLDVHEPVKDTGIRRTYPNMMTREGARGMEYDAWSVDGGNPPDHSTILPFTRMLSGPFDFTPGIFDLHFEELRPDNRVNTTLAKQLAYYLVIYSPLQMVADLPENYENQPAFKFIVDVPADWSETRVLNAQIGDYVTIARRERDGQDWYVGSITDEQPRQLEAHLDFLQAGKKYVAEIYADATDADWNSNPYAMNIHSALVDSDTVIRLALAPGGGQAVRIRPASEAEAGDVAPYSP